MSKKSALLPQRALTKLLAKHETWSTNKKESQLSKVFVCNRHLDALVFIARISVHAEVLNHHPEIEFSHCRVKVKLTTHDVKGITKLDAALLERIEKLSL